MERLTCDTCLCTSIVPVDVIVEDEDLTVDVVGHDSQFYTCHVCGDNWLRLVEEHESGDHALIYVHQMGMEPVLKRVADAPVASEDILDAGWSFFLDEREVSFSEWMRKLRTRQAILRSVCSN